ncbi:MAG: hypothetical protein HFJ37_04295 [Clostridia bacterium]|nr:hypothetical protein [Clostridia bacterium]
MIYEIKGQFIEVENEIEELKEYIFGRFSQFAKVEKENAENFLKFKKDKVEIKINNNYKILNSKIVKTDIYPIINNVISYLINDSCNVFIHGTIVSKENKAILIVGDFGQGKSTLAEEFIKYDYEMNSTDQTWLEIKNDGLYQKVGSIFDIKQGKIKMINTKNAFKNILITKILRIVGICDNGNTILEECKNEFHIIKNLFSHCNWSYTMPLFTDDIELYNTNKNIKEFLRKIINMDIQVINVRGDKSKIFQELGE